MINLDEKTKKKLLKNVIQYNEFNTSIIPKWTLCL